MKVTIELTAEDVAAHQSKITKWVNEYGISCSTWMEAYINFVLKRDTLMEGPVTHSTIADWIKKNPRPVISNMPTLLPKV